ncbi:MAG: hypothetical protein LBG96_15435 [Tannerella sp.]|nr:hypothetical protein [Tannerella sp.]
MSKLAFFLYVHKSLAQAVFFNASLKDRWRLFVSATFISKASITQMAVNAI